jgi:hypothetical protein
MTIQELVKIEDRAQRELPIDPELILGGVRLLLVSSRALMSGSKIKHGDRLEVSLWRSLEAGTAVGGNSIAEVEGRPDRLRAPHGGEQLPSTKGIDSIHEREISRSGGR